MHEPSQHACLAVPCARLVRPVLLLTIFLTPFLGEGLSGRQGAICACVSGSEVGGRGEWWPRLAPAWTVGLSRITGGVHSVCVWVSLRVCKRVCTSSWSEAAALGAHMSKCQKLGRLRPRDSYWVSEPCFWRVPHCTYVYISTSRPPSCSSREGSRMRK